MKKQPTPLFLRTIALIKAIPKGQVLTYGKVAELIGAPGCARHVSYILSSSSKKHKLPWHRVINSSGTISTHRHSMKQKRLLRLEDVDIEFHRIELRTYMWTPTKARLNKILKGLPEHRPGGV